MKKHFDLNAFLLGSICALLFHLAYMGFTSPDTPEESPKSSPQAEVVMFAKK